MWMFVSALGWYTYTFLGLAVRFCGFGFVCLVWFLGGF